MWVAAIKAVTVRLGKSGQILRHYLERKPLLLLLSPNLIQLSPIGMPCATSLTDGQPVKKKIHLV